ncbi:MAG: iron-containing alcohol dehydrogenase [Clostridia bacterium]|nr:iron-containing alcohol dehydrogenase [Clostridia bacterium]
MFDFTYNTPTKVYFGRNGEDKLASVIADTGCKSVLLHYGGSSAVGSGLIKRIKWTLESVGAKVSELGGVKPNPRLSLVNEGIALCKARGVDLILAVGGGSVIDSAKAIGMGTVGGGDVWDYYCGKRTPSGTIPVGVILTIAAAGSEMSKSSVITNDYTAVKRGVNAELSRPVFAILNPELTVSVPAYPTACGCADIFMHTLERYLTGGETMRLTDSIAEALMTTVIAASKAVKKNPADYAARANLMWASSISHNGLTGCGGDGGDWCVHALGHEISALYDTAHGAALTAVWGGWAKYVYKNCLGRFHKFAVQVMGVRPNGTREELALKGIDAAVEWFASLGLPTSIKQIGVNPTDEDLRLMAKKCADNNGGAKGSCKVLKEEDMLAVYRAAYHG